MSAVYESGWVIAPCDASDATPVELAIGRPQDWQSAFRDYHEGSRVAKVRPGAATGKVRVYLRVAGAVSLVGLVLI